MSLRGICWTSELWGGTRNWHGRYIKIEGLQKLQIWISSKTPFILISSGRYFLQDLLYLLWHLDCLNLQMLFCLFLLLKVNLKKIKTRFMIYYVNDYVLIYEIMGNLSKRVGKGGVFHGLAALLQVISQRRSPREIPRSSTASLRRTLSFPTLLLRITFYF